MKSSKYEDISYYGEKRSIGLLSLLNTINTLNLYGLDNHLIRRQLFLENDWFIIFMVARRLKDSIIKESFYDMTIDGTSFYLFLRIYYDSLASVIHYLFKKNYPNNSRKWPTGSFFNQLKWFEEVDYKDFYDYKRELENYSYPIFFRKIRDIRNSLKEPAQKLNSGRLNFKINSKLPKLQELKKSVAESLFKAISFTDFVGDYFFKKLSEVKEVKRLDYSYTGYPASFMHKGEIEVYRWFTLL